MKAYRIKFSNRKTCNYIVKSIFELREFNSLKNNLENIIHVEEVHMWDIKQSALLAC
jgi:hypothetical protein